MVFNNKDAEKLEAWRIKLAKHEFLHNKKIIADSNRKILSKNNW